MASGRCAVADARRRDGSDYSVPRPTRTLRKACAPAALDPGRRYARAGSARSKPEPSNNLRRASTPTTRTAVAPTTVPTANVTVVNALELAERKVSEEKTAFESREGTDHRTGCDEGRARMSCNNQQQDDQCHWAHDDAPKTDVSSAGPRPRTQQCQ